jgi:hypothetical protein
MKCFVRDDLQYCGLEPHLSEKSFNPECPMLVPPIEESISEFARYIAKNLTLRQVFVFARHGDRFISEESFCLDPEHESLHQCRSVQGYAPSQRKFIGEYLNKLQSEEEEYESCTVGQLTVRGFNQHVRNGIVLRNSYIQRIKLLSSHLDHSEVYVRSTDYSRTISSAQGMLMGMFESESIWMHSDHLLDIQVEPRGAGIIAPNPNLYPALLSYYSAEVLHELAIERPEIKQSLEELEQKLNMKFGLHNVTKIFDCLNVNKCHDRSISVDQDLILKLANELAPKKYELILNNPDRFQHGKISCGPLLSAVRREIMKNVDPATFTGEPRKFYIILGHDTGPMMPLLVGLGIWDGQWPAYASRIILEIYEDSNDKTFYFRIMYNEVEQIIAECSDTLCKWSDFSQLLEQLIPNDQEFSFDL